MSLSKLTLALFEDSGWYKANSSMEENIEWGKNKGCDFVYDSCIFNKKKAFAEFCDEPEELGCSFTG